MVRALPRGQGLRQPARKPGAGAVAPISSCAPVPAQLNGKRPGKDESAASCDAFAPPSISAEAPDRGKRYTRDPQLATVFFRILKKKFRFHAPVMTDRR